MTISRERPARSAKPEKPNQRSRHLGSSTAANWVSYDLKGGPEPLEKESHEFLGSKRDDRFANPFFEMVQKICQGSFFVPALE